MRSTTLLRIAGWSALLSAATVIVGVLAYFPWGGLSLWRSTFRSGAPLPLTEFSRFILPLSMLPVVGAVYWIHRRDASVRSGAAALLGASGLVVVLGVRLLETSGLATLGYGGVGFTAETIAGIGVGVWQLMSSYVENPQDRLSKDIFWVGFLAGISLVLQMVLSWISLSSPRPPPPRVNSVWLFSGLLSGVCGFYWVFLYPIWALWLGRHLLAGRGESD